MSQSLSCWRLIERKYLIKSQMMPCCRNPYHAGDWLKDNRRKNRNFAQRVAILIMLEIDWKMHSVGVLHRWLTSRNPYHAGDWLKGIKVNNQSFYNSGRNPYHAGDWLKAAGLESVFCLWCCRNPYHAGDWLKERSSGNEGDCLRCRNPYHAGDWLKDISFLRNFGRWTVAILIMLEIDWKW